MMTYTYSRSCLQRFFSAYSSIRPHRYFQSLELYWSCHQRYMLLWVLKIGLKVILFFMLLLDDQGEIETGHYRIEAGWCWSHGGRITWSTCEELDAVESGAAPPAVISCTLRTHVYYNRISIKNLCIFTAVANICYLHTSDVVVRSDLT